MRTMWRGAISFGLVTIPVKMYSATDEKTPRFNQLHEPDGGRIRYKRVCSIDGQEVPYDEIVKGYEYEKDRYVVLTDEDFAAIAPPSSRAIEIQRFVEEDEIDPIYFQRGYYLVPETTGAKAYALLREAMGDQGKVAVCKVTFRDKEHLSALRLRDKALVLETMYWPDEIRDPAFDELEGDVDVRPQEVKMARSLIESLTESFQPREFKDEYREAVEELVQRKVQGQEITAAEAPEPAKVVDLMEALRASVEAAKSGREQPKQARRQRRKRAAGEN
jgi:DNA end-binding protein Ku